MKVKGWTRRGFLGNAARWTAAGIVAPQIVPARALGIGGTPPSERVNVGVISCGGRAMAESRCYTLTDKCHVVAVCDPWESKRLRAKQTFERHYAGRQRSGAYKGCDAYADFRDVLARADVDAVYIATPDHWHVPITIAAARAGKDMHTEKPLGVSIHEDLAAREAVRRHGRVFQYGAERRSTTAARHAIELVLNGRIGKVQKIYVVSPASVKGPVDDPVLPVPTDLDYDLWLGPAPWAPFSAARAISGGNGNGIFHIYDYAIGFIAGWGAHPLDIAHWGYPHIPVEYEGTGVIPTEGLFDTVMDWDVRGRYASGAEFTLKPGSDLTTFVGTKGWIAVGRGRQTLAAEPASLLEVKIEPGEIHLLQENNHYGDFLNCVLTRRTPASNINSALQSDFISHLGDICIRTGRKIKWDPKKETIVGDDSAVRMMRRALRAPWTL